MLVLRINLSVTSAVSFVHLQRKHLKIDEVFEETTSIRWRKIIGKEWKQPTSWKKRYKANLWLFSLSNVFRTSRLYVIWVKVDEKRYFGFKCCLLLLMINFGKRLWSLATSFELRLNANISVWGKEELFLDKGYSGKRAQSAIFIQLVSLPNNFLHRRGRCRLRQLFKTSAWNIPL